jgi:hypothetical protein
VGVRRKIQLPDVPADPSTFNSVTVQIKDLEPNVVQWLPSPGVGLVGSFILPHDKMGEGLGGGQWNGVTSGPPFGNR